MKPIVLIHGYSAESPTDDAASIKAFTAIYHKGLQKAQLI